MISARVCVWVCVKIKQSIFHIRKLKISFNHFKNRHAKNWYFKMRKMEKYSKSDDSHCKKQNRVKLSFFQIENKKSTRVSMQPCRHRHTRCRRQFGGMPTKDFQTLCWAYCNQQTQRWRSNKQSKLTTKHQEVQAKKIK